MPITLSDEDQDAIRASNPEGLPLPRLQLTWLPGETPAHCRCLYCLLIPVDRLDIRNERECGFTVAPIGSTNVRCGAPWEPVWEDGSLDIPFRDGSHAAWDSHALGIPAFVVYGDRWQAVKSRSAAATFEAVGAQEPPQ